MTATTVATAGSPAEPGSGAGEGRLIDPRGQRFGASVSVIVLALGLLGGYPIIVPFVGIALGISALFGTRYFILGRPWPVVRRVLRLARCPGHGHGRGQDDCHSPRISLRHESSVP